MKLGITNASVFAYVADGKNGLRVVQLTSPDETPGNLRLQPAADAAADRDLRARTAGALAVSKGIDRDRAVDESGNQIGVFGRVGGRPLTLPEMQRLYLRDGNVYTVSDEPPAAPRAPAAPKKEEEPATEPQGGPRIRRQR